MTHEKFEYIYTQARRFQDIHVDIPPKFLSFVFYIPEHNVSDLEEERNATVFYDKNLVEYYGARYKANSLCIFAPHFYSYHGFSSTIERGVLVMFLVNAKALARWNANKSRDVAPFNTLKDAIEAKLTVYPLIEYGRDPARILAEREACLINAPQGRVMRDDQGKPTPIPG